MNDLLSVIIPVYNVENTLKRCVDSVLLQKYKNIEIVLVDDGSTDSSGRMCDELRLIDNRIKVLHKSNGGLSSARNAGLDLIQGQYVAFLDSDDYIHPDMYINLMNSINKYSLDTAFCSINKVLKNGEIIPIIENDRDVLLTGNNIIEQFLTRMFCNPDHFGNKPYQYEMAVWRGIYSVKIIKKYNITFISERDVVSEDILFDLDYLIHTDCILFLNEHYHFYCDNDSSLTAQYKEETISKLFILYDEIFNRLKSIDEKYTYLADVLLLTRIRDLVHLCIQKQGNLKALLQTINNSDVTDSVYKSINLSEFNFRQKFFYSILKLNSTILIKLLVNINKLH